MQRIQLTQPQTPEEPLLFAISVTGCFNVHYTIPRPYSFNSQYKHQLSSVVLKDARDLSPHSVDQRQNFIKLFSRKLECGTSHKQWKLNSGWIPVYVKQIFSVLSNLLRSQAFMNLGQELESRAQFHKAC